MATTAMAGQQIGMMGARQGSRSRTDSLAERRNAHLPGGWGPRCFSRLRLQRRLTADRVRGVQRDNCRRVNAGLSTARLTV